MHKIGIISDTHGLLRPEVINALGDCEAILHSGDFDTEKILEILERIAPVYAVRGNNDDWVEEPAPSHSSRQLRSLPETLSIELYGVRFFMIHNRKMIPKDTSDFDVIIYGHSHTYEEKYIGRQLWLNPGSCGQKRFLLPATMALLEIAENGSFQLKRVDLDNPHNDNGGIKTSKGFGRKRKQPPNIKYVIEQVMKDTEKKIPVKKIADRHGINQELAEQVCRLYLTHPGIGADGIIRKMGL